MGIFAKWLAVGPGKEEMGGIPINRDFKKTFGSVINPLAPLQAYSSMAHDII